MIYKYEVINPVVNHKSPFFDNKRGLFCFPVINKYRYYIECAVNNTNTGNRDYYILLSRIKFDTNCRLCDVDNYNRCKVKIIGELKEYVIKETNWRGNINVEHVETNDEYDVFKIE